MLSKWDNIKAKANKHAKERCAIVMRKENPIKELMERKIKLLERSVNLCKGSRNWMYDEAELFEINRILEINSLKNKINE